MKTRMINLFAVFSIFLICCSNEKNESQKECEWIIVNEKILDDMTSYLLDSLFSDKNTVISTIENDTLLLVINNNEDLNEICENDLDINFNDLCIIGGYYNTGSISDSIDKTDLSKCDILDEYKYEILIEKCVECWPATNKLFFWGAYPKNDIAKISLIIK